MAIMHVAVTLKHFHFVAAFASVNGLSNNKARNVS
jgi:hypothetical protein